MSSEKKSFWKTGAVIVLMAALLFSSSFIPFSQAEQAPPAPAPAAAPAVPETDWREVLVQSAVRGDNHAGLEAQHALGDAVRYEDLFLLAKIITWECGPNWPDWAVMAIGEVVLNRVASAYFPGTVREVLYQTEPVQYEPVWSEGWEAYRPPERSVRLALRLLEGERVIQNPAVVFQALFPQGDGVAFTYHDEDLNNDTYFCWVD